MGAGRMGEQGPTEEWQQDPDSALPSHGELHHSKSGARPTQLRLEIWIAPDRLHSHHPHREPGRAATTLPASKLNEESPGEAAGGRGLVRSGDHDVSTPSSECRVTPGSRRVEGEETRTGRRA